MAIATLRFDLNDPDDYRDFQIATRARDMHSVLFHITANMFREMEYVAESGIDTHELLEKIREYINDQMSGSDLHYLIDNL